MRRHTRRCGQAQLNGQPRLIQQTGACQRGHGRGKSSPGECHSNFWRTATHIFFSRTPEYHRVVSHLMRTGAVGHPAAPDAADRGVSKRQWEKTVYRWRTELRNFAIPPVALQLNLPSATRQRPPMAPRNLPYAPRRSNRCWRTLLALTRETCPDSKISPAPTCKYMRRMCVCLCSSSTCVVDGFTTAIIAIIIATFATTRTKCVPGGLAAHPWRQPAGHSDQKKTWKIC